MNSTTSSAFNGRKFLVFDIDGTMFRWSLMIHLFLLLIDRGKFPGEIRDHANELHARWKRREGGSAFEDYLLYLVDMFEQNIGNGLTSDDLRRAAEDVMKNNGDEVYVFARSLLRSAQEAGYVCIALSHSPQEIVELFGKKWGFDISVGTIMHAREDGRYTGSRDLPEKPDVLRKIVKRHGLTWEESIGMGNTTSDVGMILETAVPILFNPTVEMDEAVRTALTRTKRAPWQRIPTIITERTNRITADTYNPYAGYLDTMKWKASCRPIPAESRIREAVIRHVLEAGYKVL